MKNATDGSVVVSPLLGFTILNAVARWIFVKSKKCLACTSIGFLSSSGQYFSSDGIIAESYPQKLYGGSDPRSSQASLPLSYVVRMHRISIILAALVSVGVMGLSAGCEEHDARDDAEEREDM